MTLALGVLAAAALGLLVGQSFHLRAEKEKSASYLAMLNEVRSQAGEDVLFMKDHLEEIIVAERERSDVSLRLLDQYRMEGVQKPYYIDYGEQTPQEIAPLPREAQEWLLGLDEEVRDEYEGLIRARVEGGEQIVDILISLSQVA